MRQFRTLSLEDYNAVILNQMVFSKKGFSVEDLTDSSLALLDYHFSNVEITLNKGDIITFKWVETKKGETINKEVAYMAQGHLELISNTRLNTVGYIVANDANGRPFSREWAPAYFIALKKCGHLTSFYGDTSNLNVIEYK